jgi:molybdopterin synthase catalytic subunit
MSMGDVKQDIRLLRTPFDEVAEYGAFAGAFSHCGALASFAGRVRGGASDGHITALYLDWYPGMSEASLETIGRDAATRFEVEAIKIWHRCGEVKAAEVIVLVCAASSHRRAAFEAVDYMMDRLKSEAALWKREEGVDAEGVAIARWIEPTQNDRKDMARWDKE